MRICTYVCILFTQFYNWPIRSTVYISINNNNKNVQKLSKSLNVARSTSFIKQGSLNSFIRTFLYAIQSVLQSLKIPLCYYLRSKKTPVIFSSWWTTMVVEYYGSFGVCERHFVVSYLISLDLYWSFDTDTSTLSDGLLVLTTEWSFGISVKMRTVVGDLT